MFMVLGTKLRCGSGSDIVSYGDRKEVFREEGMLLMEMWLRENG